MLILGSIILKHNRCYRPLALQVPIASKFSVSHLIVYITRQTSAKNFLIWINAILFYNFWKLSNLLLFWSTIRTGLPLVWNEFWRSFRNTWLHACLTWVSWKQRPLRPPKTPKLENKGPPLIFFGAPKLGPVGRQYDCKLSIGDKNLSQSQTDIRGIGFVLNRKTLCFVSSKELTPCLFEVFNFHRK